MSESEALDTSELRYGSLAEQEFIKMALNAQKDTFFVFDPETEKAIRWNKAFSEVSGYSDDEIRSMKAPRSYYSDDDLAKAASAIETLNDGDTTVVEMSLITKSGEAIPTEYVGSALRDEKGDSQYIVAVGRNITRRRQAEEALRQLNADLEQRVAERTMACERYRLAFENARDAILWADAGSGLLLDCNAAAERLFEKDRDEILGKHQSTLHPPGEKDRYASIFAEVASGRRPEQDDLFIITKSGKKVSIHVASSMISLGDRPIIQGIFIDVTERRNAEEQLRRSEKRYKTLIGNIPDVTWTTDRHGNTTFISPNIQDIYGYSPEEIYARTHELWLDRIHPEDVEDVKHAFEALFETGSRYDVEYRTQKKNGDWMWLHDRAISTHPRDGMAYAYGILTDVTALREAKDQLRKTEKKYRTVADFTYDWEYWEAPDGKMLYVSPSCERITGFRPEEFIADPELTNSIVVEEDQLTWDAFRRLVRDVNEPPELQFRIRRRDGEERWIEHVCRPVTNSGTESQGFRISNRDITERKVAEIDLDSVRNSLAEAQRIAHMGSWEWDIVTGELTWSDEVYRIFGLLPRSCDPTYTMFMEAVHPNDRSAVEQAVSVALAGTAAGYAISHRVVRPDGTERVVHERGEVLREDGHPVTMIGTVQDVTTIALLRHEADVQRDALARVSRTASMEKLAGSIAHELNQPLTGILSNAQAGEMMIERDLCSCDEMKTVISEIVSDAKRAGEVIRNLRDIYRKQDSELVPVDLVDVVQDTVSLLHSEFVLQEVNLDIQLPYGATVVNGNRVQLQQVLLNLLSNAVEAMQGLEQAARHLTVSVETVADVAAVAVADRGAGIGAARLPGIFEPLATWKPGGTGMGLAISASIIKSHGGHMWAEDRSEGGARVGFRIPLKGAVDDV